MKELRKKERTDCSLSLFVSPLRYLLVELIDAEVTLFLNDRICKTLAIDI